MESIETSAMPKLFSLDRIATSFSADFLDAGICAAFVLEQLHGEGARCPQCGADLQGQKRGSFRSWGRVRCSECGKWFAATTGTALHKAKIDCRQLVMIAYFLSIGVDASLIAAAAGVDVETVRTWGLKFQALGGVE